MKLYEAYSTFDYRGFKDVTFHWFVTDRRPEPELPVTPKEALSDYHDLDEGDRVYALSYIAELLTESEVDALSTYLRQHHGIGLSKVRHIELPIKGKGIMGMGALAMGGGTDFYMLSREETYNLDVPIWGYFDLRECARVNPTTGAIVVGQDHEGDAVIVITLFPGDDFTWEYPNTLISHVTQLLEGIAPSQLCTDDDLPF